MNYFYNFNYFKITNIINKNNKNLYKTFLNIY